MIIWKLHMNTHSIQMRFLWLRFDWQFFFQIISRNALDKRTWINCPYCALQAWIGKQHCVGVLLICKCLDTMRIFGNDKLTLPMLRRLSSKAQGLNLTYNFGDIIPKVPFAKHLKKKWHSKLNLQIYFNFFPQI